MAVHAERHMEVVTSQESEEMVPAGQDSRYRLARRITYYALNVVEVLLASRFLLKAFGASPDSPFVQFMYAASSTFVAPFQGIFQSTAVETAAVFEWSTLVAMAVYLLIAIGVVALAKLIIKGGRPAQDETLER